MVSTMTMTQTSVFSVPPHQLRTYVVLTAKSSRSRLPSFTDLLEESPTMKSTALPDDCVAFESYAAVAARYQSGAATSPTRDLRWSDIARPRLYVASFLSTNKATKNGKPLSQKARKRQLRRAGTSSGSANDRLEIHALELCFEFLELADLQRATLVCSEFRDVVVGSARLLVGLYARKWQVSLSSAYYTLGFKPMLDMFMQRRADVEYLPVTTRSQVTKRADATTEIVNNSLLRILTRSAVDSVRSTQPLPVLSCARALGRQVGYFEVTMKGCGSVGVVSISDASTRSAYGYGSDEHVGWKGISYGYHGNDGDFVYNDGTAKYGGEWKPYGPSWGGMNTHDDADAAQFVVGCGLDMATHRLFFTRNGTFLGFAPVAVPAGEYAAAVSLHEFNDSAILNGGSAPFRYDIEGFCASL